MVLKKEKSIAMERGGEDQMALERGSEDGRMVTVKEREPRSVVGTVILCAEAEQ